MFNLLVTGEEHQTPRAVGDQIIIIKIFINDPIRNICRDMNIVIHLVTSYSRCKGETSQELLTQAEWYIREIRTLDPGFRLEEGYFSPKVVEIFSRGYKEE